GHGTHRIAIGPDREHEVVFPLLSIRRVRNGTRLCVEAILPHVADDADDDKPGTLGVGSELNARTQWITALPEAPDGFLVENHRACARTAHFFGLETPASAKGNRQRAKIIVADFSVADRRQRPVRHGLALDVETRA